MGWVGKTSCLFLFVVFGLEIRDERVVRVGVSQLGVYAGGKKRSNDASSFPNRRAQLGFDRLKSRNPGRGGGGEVSGRIGGLRVHFDVIQAKVSADIHTPTTPQPISLRLKGES